jgi:hypothetical protein
VVAGFAMVARLAACSTGGGRAHPFSEVSWLVDGFVDDHG